MKKKLLIVAFFLGCFSYGQQQWTGVDNTTGNIERTGKVTIVNNDLSLFSSLHKSIGFSTFDRTTDNVANYGLTNTPENTVTLSGWNGLNFYTGTVPRMSITNVGNVGIGKTNPNSMLDVNGEITALAIKGPSDIRFKKNLKPLENSLSKISSLKGYSYEWRKDEFPNKNFRKGTDIGLIAQEVEKVFPEVVYTDNDEMKSKSIDYSKLVPALVESIKELQKEIEALRAELNKKK